MCLFYILILIVIDVIVVRRRAILGAAIRAALLVEIKRVPTRPAADDDADEIGENSDGQSDRQNLA